MIVQLHCIYKNVLVCITKDKLESWSARQKSKSDHIVMDKLTYVCTCWFVSVCISEYRLAVKKLK